MAPPACCAVGPVEVEGVLPPAWTALGLLDDAVSVGALGFAVALEVEACAGAADAVVVAWDMALAPRFAFLCHRLRSPVRPVVSVTDGSAEEHALALVSGADAVIPSPVRLVVVTAEVVAHRRRAAPAAAPDRPAATAGGEAPDDEVWWGSLAVSVAVHRATVEGRPLALTPRQVRLLALLVGHPGVPYSRDRLLSEVWGLEFDPETNVVDVTVHRLRSILRAAGAGEAIRTVRGVGYAVGE